MQQQQKSGFLELGIIPSLLKGIKQLNLKTPTPIQQAAIPAGIEGNDIMALAKTGSGKTLAFGIPTSAAESAFDGPSPVTRRWQPLRPTQT